jgi:hypothetical protein
MPVRMAQYHRLAFEGGKSTKSTKNDLTKMARAGKSFDATVILKVLTISIQGIILTSFLAKF